MAELTTTAYSLASIGELKAYLGKDEAASRDDALLVRVIEGVSRMCEHYCGRNFLSRTYTHDGNTMPLLNGSGTPMLFLNHRPVTAISVLKAWPNGPTLTEGWDGEFTVDNLAGVVELNNGLTFFKGQRTVTITYVGGYLPTGGGGGVTLGTPASWQYGWQEAAADLRLSILKQMAEMVHRRERDRDGIVSRTVAGETYTYSANELLTDVKATWDRYKGLGMR